MLAAVSIPDIGVDLGGYLSVLGQNLGVVIGVAVALTVAVVVVVMGVRWVRHVGAMRAIDRENEEWEADERRKRRTNYGV
jgi:hypothetical protein